MLNPQLVKDLLANSQREITDLTFKMSNETDQSVIKSLLKEHASVNKIILDLMKYKQLEPDAPKKKKLILN
jgi:hypothetical protein